MPQLKHPSQDIGFNSRVLRTSAARLTTIAKEVPSSVAGPGGETKPVSGEESSPLASPAPHTSYPHRSAGPVCRLGQRTHTSRRHHLQSPCHWVCQRTGAPCPNQTGNAVWSAPVSNGARGRTVSESDRTMGTLSSGGEVVNSVKRPNSGKGLGFVTGVSLDPETDSEGPTGVRIAPEEAGCPNMRYMAL